jgi:hypothetical protein
MVRTKVFKGQLLITASSEGGLDIWLELEEDPIINLKLTF